MPSGKRRVIPSRTQKEAVANRTSGGGNDRQPEPHTTSRPPHSTICSCFSLPIPLSRERCPSERGIIPVAILPGGLQSFRRRSSGSGRSRRRGGPSTGQGLCMLHHIGNSEFAFHDKALGISSAVNSLAPETIAFPVGESWKESGKTKKTRKRKEKKKPKQKKSKKPVIPLTHLTFDVQNFAISQTQEIKTREKKNPADNPFSNSTYFHPHRNQIQVMVALPSI
jgi:hypothetical protein